jgi:hypothetical protein
MGICEGEPVEYKDVMPEESGFTGDDDAVSGC